MTSLRSVLILTLIMLTTVLHACRRDRGAPAPDPAPLPTGQEVVNHFLTYVGCHDAKLKVQARVTNEDGTTREFIIMTYQKCADGVQYSLRQVIVPESERSRALLTVEKPGQPVENVAYLPGFKKFVEVQDLRREDTVFGLSIQESLGGYDLYDYKMLGTERVGQYETYQVEGRLKPETESRFKRTITCYRRDNFLPVRMELYNLQNQLVRVKQYTHWDHIDGRWTETRSDVENLQYKKRIVFDTVEADYTADLPLWFFTRENLKRLIVSDQ
jgi:hypothetical protein